MSDPNTDQPSPTPPTLPSGERHKFVNEAVTGERLEDLRRFAGWVADNEPSRDQATAWLVEHLGRTDKTAGQSLSYLLKSGILTDSDGKLVPAPEIADWIGQPDDTLTPVRVMHRRIAFVGELLAELRPGPKTLIELLRIANQGFGLDFRELRQIHERLAWLEKAGLVETAGGTSRRITGAGADLLAGLRLQPRIAELTGPRYWVCALGDGSALWPECREGRFACIGWDHLGNLLDYNAREDLQLGMNNSLACWEFSRKMQPGDVVFVKKGYHHILGHGTVAGGYRFDRDRTTYKNLRRVHWHTHFPDGTPVAGKRLPQKTLTDVTDDAERLDPLLAAIDPDYSIDSILKDGCFLEPNQLKRLLARLESKKNLILQGPPGTGKTWLAKRLAYALIGRRDRASISAVQFHPTLSYEDFVLGWRPSNNGLRLTDGAFLRAIEAAKQQAPTPFVVVIEEINRGNPAQIFGELITLLEADKRSSEDAIELAYADDGESRSAYIPENLYVIGTMNIADRSLALVDLALRRRFAFATLEPALGERWRHWVTGTMGVTEALATDIEQRLVALNNAIADDPALGPQFRVGHSYVTPSRPLPANGTKGWFRDVAETEIGPLLREYWYDHPEKANSALQTLLSGW